MCRIKRISFFFLFIFTFLSLGSVYGQCCSTGSPVGASVYVGVLNKYTLRMITYYRYSYSDTYYENDHKAGEPIQLKSAYYNFAGIALAYGITKRLTVETDWGYFFNKTQVFNSIDYQEKGYGFSNGGVTFKYGAFIKPVQQIELTVGLGFRYPFTTKPLVVDGVQLSRDVQPSTNAFAGTGLFFFNKGFPSITLRLFTINRYDYNFEGLQDYQYGSILLNSIFVSKKIVKYFFGILQLRSEWKTNDKDKGNNVVNSGYYLLTLSPQLSYSIIGKWNVTFVFDVPLYKNYNGKQMTPKYSMALSLTRDFNLAKKLPPPPVK